jgi:hypothetical protein
MGIWSSMFGSSPSMPIYFSARPIARNGWRKAFGVPKLTTRTHRTIRHASKMSPRQYRMAVHAQRAYTRSKYTGKPPTGKYRGLW